MILQSLVELYEALVVQGKLQGAGWAGVKISYALDINDDGEVERVSSIKTEQTRGKNTVLVPQIMTLPAPVKRSTNIASNFLWDSSTYILGVDTKGNPQRSLECFKACKALHHEVLDGVASPTARAVRAFFTHWDPEDISEHPAFQECVEDVISGVNLTFRYHGELVCEDTDIRQAWQNHYDVPGDGPEMTCLITGKKGPIELVHPAIKGVPGGQSSGTALVSFNAPSFCSYGHEQGANAPMSKYAAFAYTSALNYLLADREHLWQMGNTTVLCWAKSGEEVYQNLFSPLAFGTTLRNDPEIVDRYGEVQVDPNMEFFILGISPNAARLSIRFFLHNSFGSFLKNVQNHYDRMEIIRPSYDTLETVPLWKLLDATVNQNSKDKTPSPIMAGAATRAILNDTHYPASLLNGINLRIRADHEVDRIRAGIIKAYYLKNTHPDVPKEVLTVSLNPASNNPAYVLGRLFSVYEAIQNAANPGIDATIKDRYFNSAAATPATIFPVLGNLAQKHLRKLKGANMGLNVFYNKQITEIMGLLGTGFPARLSLAQQGAFQLGYYHQTQDRYQKKEEE